MKSIWISVAVVLLVFTSAVWLIDSVQKVESYYESYQKLKESELMNRGWVSRIIPTSSYDIYETRGLDGKIVDVHFRFQPGDTQTIEPGCTALPHNTLMVKRYRCAQTVEGVILSLDASGQGQILTR